MGSARLAVLVVLVATLMELVATPFAQASQSTLSSLIPQFPRAELVESYEQQEPATHEIMLGPVKRVGGKVEPEKSDFVVGRRISTTWHVPNEQRTSVVYKFFRDALADKGDILFECKGFDCGSSSYWANKVFGRSILYGPEQDQHYFLTRVEGDSTYYISTYVALRGTRKLYVHTDVIVAEGRSREMSGAAIIEALKAKGRFVIDAGSEDRAIAAVVEAMALEPLFRIAVVSHQRKERGESLQQSISRSEKLARAMVAKLIVLGVNSTRVEGFGIGPLAPLERDVIDRTEIVLISAD